MQKYVNFIINRITGRMETEQNAIKMFNLHRKKDLNKGIFKLLMSSFIPVHITKTICSLQ